MKKFRDGWAEGTHAYHAIREKLRHQLRHRGRVLIWKQKIWLAICEFLWSLTNQNTWFVSSFYTELTLFCNLKKKTALLLTNQNGEIFSCISLGIKQAEKLWSNFHDEEIMKLKFQVLALCQTKISTQRKMQMSSN